MSDTSHGLVEFFTLKHRQCDGRWADVVTAADAGAADAVAESWGAFRSELLVHLKMEEEVLFPAFEVATGMTDGGPTFMMRSEHDQMRGLVEQMDVSADGGDHGELTDLGDTLLILIQQHNQKEEHMLYPMAERALAADWAKILERLIEY
jgi:iron-sulfur cluster repair protein YtfE (RIC family)